MLQLPALEDRGGPAQPLLIIRGLKKYFPIKNGMFKPAGFVQAVDDLNFEVNKGETLGIVGESGCGKSTASRLVMALIDPTEGEIIFDGEKIGTRELPLKEYRRQVQMVFQDSYASLNPRLNIEESIAFGPTVHGLERAISLHRARELLNAVGLMPAQYAHRFPHELSGGQRQRVNIARALALRPRMLILDEPVSALDKSVEAQVLNMLMDIKSQFDLTYLFISHDLRVVQHVSDRVLVMYLGRVAEIGPVDAMFDNPLHPYTQALLASRPSMDPDKRREKAPLSGDPPNPVNPPSGCRFRTRCQFAEEVCASDVPSMSSHNAAHQAACHIIAHNSGHSQSIHEVA
jgi:peptide/nickel transport system ATP-binding protein